MSAIIRDLPRRLPHRAGRPSTDDVARQVSLHHEAARVAASTPLAPTYNGRLQTITETVGYLAAAVRDLDPQLRPILLALHVQTQLWLNDLDRDAAA